jgi:alpha-L-fucosidase
MLLTCIAALAMTPAQAPKIAVPSKRQLDWHKLEYYAFVHFGPNTFTDKEWGEGKEDPNVFNPTQLDARQWVRIFKEAGMKQVIITAKHHDGFCLWPSAYSKHTVAQSSWKGGKGDVLAELRKACNEYGMKMGVYLSPWDRNHPKYGTPEYNQVFADMLKEVLTKYGPIYEVWFDGANGEGPNGKKQVYDWDLFNSTVRKYAPDAVIFGDGGPDVRWVGNEQGWAPEECWATIQSKRYVPGTPLHNELGKGNPDGDQWTPAECDVSIRPGWFYHASQDDKVKTPEQLMDLYERSVGHNASLLLNVPPDRRGLIHENDVKALMGFKKLRETVYGSRRDVTFPVNEPYNAVTLQVIEPTLIDRVVLSERISTGQRVKKFEVRVTDDKGQVTTYPGSTIGSKRIQRIAPTKAKSLQVVVLDSHGQPTVSVPGHATTPAAKLQADKDRRMAWFREAKFGMFIHWGLYAQPAGVWNGKNVPGAAEWILNTAQIKVADYEPLIKTFNPIKYDPKEWVRIAKDAGMKYIVITSKHHEGWALWDSKLTDWDIAGTPYKRDLLKQLALACKEAGLKLCFYHSIMDWHHPDYLPRRSWDPRPDVKANFPGYVEFMKGQLKELLTNYGDIGILWFDGEWESTWTHEQGKDLYAYVRKLQPNIIVNNRVDKGRSGMAGMTQGDHFMGDYGTPEQEIPANGFGPGVDWESCMTMNDTWGYSSHDHNWKSSAKLVQNLIDCVSKGGNYLLNVGPTALGEIPEPSVDRLREVGQWMEVNSEAIYGAQASPFPRQLRWGRITRKGKVLYLHVFKPNDERGLELPGLKTAIRRAVPLGGGPECKVEAGIAGTVVQMPPLEVGVWLMPLVIKVELAGEPVVVPVLPKQASDGSIELKAMDAKLNGGLGYESDKDCIGYWTNQADTVEWEFEAVRSEPRLEIELAAPDDSARAQFEIQVAGQSIKGTVPKTGSWSKFVKLDLGKVSIVAPGKTKLVVKPLSKPGLGVMNLRAIRLKP